MAATQSEEWRPGSFTKNFSWGSEHGLVELYEVIRAGFDNTLTDVRRDVFRSRVSKLGRPDYIPINFFLLNQPRADGDYLLVDELVFQALSFPHSARFDQIALFAFIFSMVGTWKGARSYQEQPALWAKRYVADRIGPIFHWNTSRISADDIQRFVQADPRYHAQGSRKLATNLNYLFKVGKLEALVSSTLERWWVDALFLALDRIVESRRVHNKPVSEDRYDSYLAAAGFHSITGRRSIEKDLAATHAIALFSACGGRQRFSEESVRERTETRLADVERWLANDPSPVAAVHRTNPRLIKTIPRPCAMLAKSVGFQIFDVDELAELNVTELVRENLENALDSLKSQGVSPTTSAEELMKLLRGE